MFKIYSSIDETYSIYMEINGTEFHITGGFQSKAAAEDWILMKMINLLENKNVRNTKTD